MIGEFKLSHVYLIFQIFNKEHVLLLWETISIFKKIIIDSYGCWKLEQEEVLEIMQILSLYFKFEKPGALL